MVVNVQSKEREEKGYCKTRMVMRKGRAEAGDEEEKKELLKRQLLFTFFIPSLYQFILFLLLLTVNVQSKERKETGYCKARMSMRKERAESWGRRCWMSC